MVALEEVGDLALAELWVAELAGGGRTAEDEFSSLFGAVLSALVGIDQLLNTERDIREEVSAYVVAVSTPCIFWKLYNL